MAVIMRQTGVSAPASFSFNRGWVFLTSAIAALGGLLFGFDLVIISGTVPFFTQHFSLNEYQTGWAVGCINLGCCAGALLGGGLCNRIGRKRLLLLCALFFAVTGVGTGWAVSFPVFIGFRLLSGVAVGAAALVCPVYIAELSPAALRGRMVSFYQLAITTGILLAYLSNYLLLNSGSNNWRWMFTSQSAPALLFFAGLFAVPESPRWLIQQNRNREARTVLEKIGGKGYAEMEVQSIRQSFALEVKENVRDLFKKDVGFIIFLGVVIAVFSQAGGQNSLFSYAPIIFGRAGLSKDSAFLQSVILGFINFIFTFVAIAVIDKAGRKTLLVYGSLLLSLDAIAIAAAFYLGLGGIWVLCFVLGFIAVYASTLGPVTWVTLSEIFPNRVRGNAMALATVALWLANFFTTTSFPVMKRHLGLPGTFLVHACICLLYFMLVRKWVPETKGKSLEEIEKVLLRK